ncbi:MAG: hypothetical protein B2I17_05375 [Thermoplasmatales archaeon B_DKE]|jgi:hypothetical protein|nr:MAG: hypothetical protein B2I17_05375 [Thermoplasmatales archaeon B_DKE]
MSLRSQMKVNRRMISAFLTGQAHDLYGLLGIALVSLVIFFLTYGNIAISILSLLIIAFSMGILVDLWAHGFTH